MSQHVYELKFTIRIDNPEGGVYPIHGETRERKPELLSQVMKVVDEGEIIKEDLIREAVEKKIKGAIPAQQGIISVVFDSLTES